MRINGNYNVINSDFVSSDLYLLVPAVHFSLENINDLSFTKQNLLLLVKLLFQSLQKLRRRIEQIQHQATKPRSVHLQTPHSQCIGILESCDFCRWSIFSFEGSQSVMSESFKFFFSRFVCPIETETDFRNYSAVSVGTCSKSALASHLAANLKSSCSCIWLISVSWLSFCMMMSLNVWIYKQQTQQMSSCWKCWTICMIYSRTVSTTYILFIHGLLLSELLLLCGQQLFETFCLLLQQTVALLCFSHLLGQILHQQL